MSPPRLYIETCPLVDVIKSEVGVSLEAERQNNIWYVHRCLQASLDGKLEIITSTLTIAECRRAETPPSPDKDETKRLISSILTSGRVMLLAMVTQEIAEYA